MHEDVNRLDRELHTMILDGLNAIEINNSSEPDQNCGAPGGVGEQTHTPAQQPHGAVTDCTDPKLTSESPSNQEDSALCPCCSKEVTTDGILCEKCEMWHHYQCAMLTDDDRKRFETMNDPYYCMSCTLDMQCSDPVDSSIFSFDTRNAHETDPISKGISTQVDSDPSLVERTISDETGLKQIHTVENVKQPSKNKAKQAHSSSKHNASMNQRSRSNTPAHTVVTPQPSDSRSDPQHRALLNHADNSKDSEQPVDTGQSV